jgi:hypothetical protein
VAGRGSPSARLSSHVGRHEDVCHCQDALAFVRQHGVVLASAKGTAPRLTEAIVGEDIRAAGGRIQPSHLLILGAVTASDRVLVCRLIDGKITLVHRRLWPSWLDSPNASHRSRLLRFERSTHHQVATPVASCRSAVGSSGSLGASRGAR